MNLTRWISADRIVDLQSTDKNSALKELCALVATSPNVKDGKALQKAILAREGLLSTGIGLGIAVPHAKVSSVKDFAVAVGRSTRGIEWDALDGAPAKIVVLIAASDQQPAEYTKLLAAIVGKVKPEETRAKLLAAKAPADVLKILKD
jgi:mannitol/fructose-specific phosphotransferase system IIA component (Ntr-type)